MGKVLCFVPEKYADFEVVLALHLLRDVGKREIITVSYTREPVTSYSGVKTFPDCTLEEAAALSDIEAFIMPGGPIRERDERLVSFIQTLDRQNKLLAAICFGPQYLARSGVLDARRYTTSCTPMHIQKKGIADPFPRGNFVDERVVKDGHVITAQGHAFVDFAFAVLEYAGYDRKDRKAVEQYRRDILGR
jgi:putative intracellular protease/amidase